MKDKNFMEAVGFLPPEIRTRLLSFPEQLQSETREICLRAERPVAVSTFQGDYFLGRDGTVSRLVPPIPYRVSRDEMNQFIRILTEYSIHSYQREINAGFITVQGGHRAGIAGSCVYENGRILSVNDISSVTLRIARQVKGAAENLVRTLYSGGVCSTLIAGAPASGKTTLLKDIARCLGSGLTGSFVKLSLIDERGEIAAVYRGAPQNDVGITTDVFDGYQKGEGMLIAIRSMSPRALILDEIAGEEDAASVRQGLNAGAAVIATVHAASLDELYRKTHVRTLIAEGAFQKIVILRGADAPCEVAQIAEPKELSPC